MKYAKIENGVVVQVQPYAQDGFEKVPDDVVCGQIKKGKTFENPPVSDETLKETRIDEIKAELSRIDVETMRPLRAIQTDTATQDDRDRLTDLEAQAQALRAELEELSE